jgi:hypothetical protein
VKVVFAFAAAGLAVIPQAGRAGRAVLGQGNVSCNSSEASGRVAWVLGFITGFHQYEPRPERDASSGSNTQTTDE